MGKYLRDKRLLQDIRSLTRNPDITMKEAQQIRKNLSLQLREKEAYKK
jgi:hypothetical protein